MTDHEPGWVKEDRARSAATAQLVRGQISTLDNDTLFWIDFDSSGVRAFERILCRKVGDAASYVVQHSWMSPRGNGDLNWKDMVQPYPPTSCNHTLRLKPIPEAKQAVLAMLIVHEQFTQLRHECEGMHNNALLCRAREEAGIYAGDRY